MIELLIHDFLDHKFDIVELMNRLSTLHFENDTKLESKIRILEENLESIYFCYNDTAQYYEVKKILEAFLLTNCNQIEKTV